MPSDILKELRSVASLLSAEATSNKHESSSEIAEYFKEHNAVSIDIPSLSVWSLPNSFLNTSLSPKTKRDHMRNDAFTPPPPRVSVSKAILQNLIRQGNPFSTKKKQRSSPSAVSSLPGEQQSLLDEAGKIDHKAIVKNMSTMLTFEKKREKDNGQEYGNPAEELKTEGKNMETEAKVNTDISFVASTLAQNLKKSILKVTDDHVIYYLSKLLTKNLKRSKGLIPHEAAKLLSHYSTLDNINTEDADNDFAMKSFLESEGENIHIVDPNRRNNYGGIKELVVDSSPLNDDETGKSVEMEDDTTNAKDGKKIENEQGDSNASLNNYQRGDHIAKIKSIHECSPSLREMVLGVNDDQNLNAFPALETKVKKIVTKFEVVEEGKELIPKEGNFSCAIKLKAVLTIVILKHETTLQLYEIGKISGSVDGDKSFKNLSLRLPVDSLFKSLVEIMKSSVENAVKSNDAGDIPNRRFKLEIAPINKIKSPPKSAAVTSQETQNSRKRRRSELDVSDTGDSNRNKMNASVNLSSMAFTPNQIQINKRHSFKNLNDDTSNPMTTFNNNSNNNGRRFSSGMAGQGRGEGKGPGSMATLFEQNDIQGSSIKGLNSLMNLNSSNQQNMNTNQYKVENMYTNAMNTINALNAMNALNARNNDINTVSNNNSRYQERTNSFSEAVRPAERRQSGGHQSMALALAAAETAKMRDITSAMNTLKRSSAGRSTGINSMAAAAEAVRLAEMENKLDSLGSKIGDSSLNNSNTNNYYNSLNNNDTPSPYTADILRLLESSRNSMVPYDSSQISADQAQRMDLETAMNSLRRYSNIGSNTGASDLSGILESLGREEEAARRRSSYGGNALMESVLNALRRQSASMHRPSDAGSMAAAAEAVRLAELDVMNSIKKRVSAGNSMAAAAEIVRQADLDAAMNTLIRRRSSTGNSSIAAAAEAVRLAELETSTRRRSSFARRSSSFSATSAMAAAAEIVRMSEENNAAANANRNYNNRRSFIMSDDMMKDADDIHNTISSAKAFSASLNSAADAQSSLDVEGTLASLLNQNSSFLLNQNNMDSNRRAPRSVSFRLNNTSTDNNNPMNNTGG